MILKKDWACFGQGIFPRFLAQYLFDLPKEYNVFYADLQSFSENDEAILAIPRSTFWSYRQNNKKRHEFTWYYVPDRM